ncbi:MAG: hypothetical protein WBG70_18430 [Spirulinaceae cyanobacterium]
MATKRKKSTTTKSKELAKNITSGKKTKTKALSRTQSALDVPKAISDGEVAVPGFNGFNLTKATEHTGEFDLTQFQVKDPLNPSDKLPQATQAQFSRASAIYEKATNAVKLYRSKYRLDNEAYGAVGDRATALNTGISATRTHEQAKANYLNFLGDQEKTKQAAIALDLNLSTTAQNLAASQVDKEQMVTELQLKETNLEKTKTQLEEARGELDIYQSKLGKYLPAS